VSRWGTLEASFNTRSTLPDADTIRAELESRDPIAPTGSEDGPSVHGDKDGIYVQGRLRDVCDDEDSAKVLAWFVRHARWCESATLLWDLDGGPRYRYEWRDGGLRKLKGVLDL
jgi:hypothetical protein